MNICKECGDGNAYICFADGCYCFRCSWLRFKEKDRGINKAFESEGLAVKKDEPESNKS